MSSSANVRQDGTLLSRIDRSLFRLERIFAMTSGAVAFALMLLAAVSVAGRSFFNAPLPGYIDWIEQAMLFLALLGIGFTQREGGHIRMDMLVHAFKGRLHWAIELFTTLAAAVLVLALIWGSWAHFKRSFSLDAPRWSRDSSIDIGLPLWPAKLVVPVALAFLLLRLIIQVAAYYRALRCNSQLPVGVPLSSSSETEVEDSLSADGFSSSDTGDQRNEGD